MTRTAGSFGKTSAPTSARGKAWQVMRVMRRFTSGDIITTTGIVERNCVHYLQHLARAGYLRQEKARDRRINGNRDLWLLVRDSGPKAPILRRDGSVYDQNTFKAYVPEGEQ